MSWIENLVDDVKGVLSSETPKPAPLPEERWPFHDLAIESRVPPDYKVQYVTRCRSCFYFSPDEWIRDDEPERTCQNRYAIEVLNSQGRVMAAVGWYTYENEPRVYTIATYVSSRLKRRGLGRALWRAMIEIIREQGYTGVHGCAASNEGYTLLRAMKEEFPDVVTFDGDRPPGWEFWDLRQPDDMRKGRVA